MVSVGTSCIDNQESIQHYNQKSQHSSYTNEVWKNLDFQYQFTNLDNGNAATQLNSYGSTCDYTSIYSEHKNLCSIK
jgi:hypothetical protein